MNRDRQLQLARTGTRRKGQADCIKHLEGDELTRQQAIDAACYQCVGYGESGACELTACPLWPYSPYGGRKDA